MLHLFGEVWLITKFKKRLRFLKIGWWVVEGCFAFRGFRIVDTCHRINLIITTFFFGTYYRMLFILFWLLRYILLFLFLSCWLYIVFLRYLLWFLHCFLLFYNKFITSVSRIFRKHLLMIKYMYTLTTIGSI